MTPEQYRELIKALDRHNGLSWWRNFLLFVALILFLLTVGDFVLK